jgi:hypothetical protein
MTEKELRDAARKAFAEGVARERMKLDAAHPVPRDVGLRRLRPAAVPQARSARDVRL